MSSFLSGAPDLLGKGGGRRARSSSPGKSSRSGALGAGAGARGGTAGGSPGGGSGDGSDLDSTLEALLGKKKPKPRSKSKPVGGSRRRLRRNSSQVNSAHMAFNHRDRRTEDDASPRRNSLNDEQYSLHKLSPKKDKKREMRGGGGFDNGGGGGADFDDGELDDGEGERGSKSKRAKKQKKKQTQKKATKKSKKDRGKKGRSPGSHGADDDRAAALERELMSQLNEMNELAGLDDDDDEDDDDDDDDDVDGILGNVGRDGGNGNVDRPKRRPKPGTGANQAIDSPKPVVESVLLRADSPIASDVSLNLDASAEIAVNVVPTAQDDDDADGDNYSLGPSSRKNAVGSGAATASVASDQTARTNVVDAAVGEKRSGAEERERDVANQGRDTTGADDESSLSMSWDDDISASSLMDMFDEKKDKDKAKAEEKEKEKEMQKETEKEKTKAKDADKDTGALSNMRMGSESTVRSTSSRITSYSPSTRSSDSRAASASKPARGKRDISSSRASTRRSPKSEFSLSGNNQGDALEQYGRNAATKTRERDTFSRAKGRGSSHESDAVPAGGRQGRTGGAMVMGGAAGGTAVGGGGGAGGAGGGTGGGGLSAASSLVAEIESLKRRLTTEQQKRRDLERAAASAKRLEAEIGRFTEREAASERRASELAEDNAIAMQRAEVRASERLEKLRLLHEEEKNALRRSSEAALKAAEERHKNDAAFAAVRERERNQVNDLAVQLATMASRMDKLVGSAESDRKEANGALSAQLAAREVMVAKSEQALLDMRRAAEEETSRLKGLLVSLQNLEQRNRSSLEQDRARLREEGLRVEAAQIAASAAADAARQGAAKGRAVLAEERLEFAKEKVRRRSWKEETRGLSSNTCRPSPIITQAVHESAAAERRAALDRSFQQLEVERSALRAQKEALSRQETLVAHRSASAETELSKARNEAANIVAKARGEKEKAEAVRREVEAARSALEAERRSFDAEALRLTELGEEIRAQSKVVAGREKHASAALEESRRFMAEAGEAERRANSASDSAQRQLVQVHEARRLNDEVSFVLPLFLPLFGSHATVSPADRLWLPTSYAPQLTSTRPPPRPIPSTHSDGVAHGNRRASAGKELARRSPRGKHEQEHRRRAECALPLGCCDEPDADCPHRFIIFGPNGDQI